MASPHTTVLGSGSGQRLLRKKLQIRVRRGPDKKLKRDFQEDHIVIGTHEKCELALSDRSISRQHLEVSLVEGGYKLRDLGSTNGTVFSGAKIGEMTFSGAIELQLGKTTLSVTPLEDAVEIPLPPNTAFGDLLGVSPAMRKVFDRLARVAGSDATVLIHGESGTGKELAARAIHDASPRAKGPFIVVDCGAIPENLIESELYGHVRGAFTGATEDRPGAFRAAHGGTIFLDEIGELPRDVQTRLLGALERRRVQPVGANKTSEVDTRVVAATHRDLRKAVNQGGFREDLYYRLAVITVEMPALRERREDIPLYVQQFIREFGADEAGFSVDAATLADLQGQSWPGNVRQLRNVIERATALGEVTVPQDAQASPASGDPSEVSIQIPFKQGKQALIENYERQYVTALIAAHQNNITQAARAAKIDRVYLLRVLDKYGLRPKR